MQQKQAQRREAAALRILHLEDSAIDAALVQAHLSAGDPPCEITLADGQASYRAALSGGRYDVILADYQLPDFDGLSALRIAREHAPETPFIFVSGTLGEETAVEAMRQGATDYVLKQRLARLPVAVSRAVAETRMRAEERRMRVALGEGEERYRLIVESARDYAIFTTDLAGVVTSWNSGAQRILGFPAEEILGGSSEVMFTPEDRAARRLEAEMREALERGSAEDERWHLKRDGSRFWAMGAMMPLRGEGTEVRGFLKILRDRTDWRRAEERRAVLIGELNHRVKNTLATVQSLAEQTLRGSRGPGAFVPAFRARLLALARAHDLLTRESWEGATLRDTLEVALAPWRDGHGRISLRGPELRLTPRQALALAMGAQELATNAAKHGALSATGGRVLLSWHLAGSDVAVEWAEEGGPPVRTPDRRGFGTRLLGRPLATELHGEVRVDFAVEGVTCSIRFPREQTGATAATPLGDLVDAQSCGDWLD
jgi:PAS domain S-box-containing protein